MLVPRRPILKLLIRYGIVAAIGVAVIVLVIPPFATSLIEKWSERDVELRSLLAYNASVDELTNLLSDHDAARIDALFERMALDEELLAVGFCDKDGRLRYPSKMMPEGFACRLAKLRAKPRSTTLMLDHRRLVVSSFPIVPGGENGHVVLLHDLTFAEQRSAQVRIWSITALVGVAFLAAALSFLVAVLLARRWLQSLRQAIDEARAGGGADAQEPIPFAPDIRHLLRELQRAERTTEGPDVDWSPDMLRLLLAQKLPNAEMIVVSNREPYIHHHDGDGVVLQTPASGLVAAIEPVMRACGGTWIAHGSGSADRETVDDADRIRVPPESPSYTLRRIWLTDDEQNGYYYGLANEGLWPLCHLAFVRPTFRESDWNEYRQINARFAQAVVSEAKRPDPIVLVQDYHFALLPTMLRKKLPNATIITFWHIPWPNPEIFGICPWKEEIIVGLLGSSVIGFHTQFYCNNFLDTVSRFMQARTDREHSFIAFGGQETLVRPYPISIEWPPAGMKRQKTVAECRSAVRERFGIAQHVRLGIGVERFDYTKGILDRLNAVDAFLCSRPEWRSQFTFLQIAAPTRSKLAAYATLQKEAADLVRDINARHGSASHQPVALIIGHFEPHEVFEFFRAADFCVVSSLHDGMNLVAKEFVAARDDEEGVLLLSTFAGASRELFEALIVNPYDTRGMADAIEQALRMPTAEQQERMRFMREIVRLRNVYRWAGQMLLDAADLRKRSSIIRMMSRPRPASNAVALPRAI